MNKLKKSKKASKKNNKKIAFPVKIHVRRGGLHTLISVWSVDHKDFGVETTICSKTSQYLKLKSGHFLVTLTKITEDKHKKLSVVKG